VLGRQGLVLLVSLFWLIFTASSEANELVSFRAGPTATYQTESQYVISPYIGWAPTVFFPEVEDFFARGMLGLVLTKVYNQGGFALLADLAVMGGYRASNDVDLELGGGFQMVPLSEVAWVPFGRVGVCYFLGNSYGFEKQGLSLLLDYTASAPLSILTHQVLMGVQLTL